MPVLFLLFIIIPIIEMWLLIEVGSEIGALNTIGLVLLTAIVGAVLLRQQGVATLLRSVQRLEHGQLPGAEIVEGILLAVGGALLLTPGFMTDFVGFICLIPYTRAYLAKMAIERGKFVAFSQSAQRFHGGSRGTSSQSGRSESKQSTVIEGEYRREDE